MEIWDAPLGQRRSETKSKEQWRIWNTEPLGQGLVWYGVEENIWGAWILKKLFEIQKFRGTQNQFRKIEIYNNEIWNTKFRRPLPDLGFTRSYLKNSFWNEKYNWSEFEIRGLRLGCPSAATLHPHSGYRGEEGGEGSGEDGKEGGRGVG